jgi:hypothetical protein
MVTTKKVGRPRLGVEKCFRDTYTCPHEIVRDFSAKCRRLGVTKSGMIRAWIEWFLVAPDEDIVGNDRESV